MTRQEKVDELVLSLTELPKSIDGDRMWADSKHVYIEHVGILYRRKDKEDEAVFIYGKAVRVDEII